MGPPTGLPARGERGGPGHRKVTSRRIHCPLAHPKQREGHLMDRPQPAGGKARDGATACHLSAGNILAAGGTERRHSEEGAGATRRGAQTTTVPGSRRCTPKQNVTTKRVEQRAWCEDLRWTRQQQSATSGDQGGASLIEAHPGPGQRRPFYWMCVIS